MSATPSEAVDTRDVAGRVTVTFEEMTNAPDLPGLVAQKADLLRRLLLEELRDRGFL